MYLDYTFTLLSRFFVSITFLELVLIKDKNPHLLGRHLSREVGASASPQDIEKY